MRSPESVRAPEPSREVASLVERFGAAVRSGREARGWSQEQLASRAGLNRSYMGEIERAAVMPSLATAAKLARALQLPLSALISACEAPANASA